jgi:signal transduction histidine kinase/ActR/RegA family two-component response regulator
LAAHRFYQKRTFYDFSAVSEGAQRAQSGRPLYRFAHSCVAGLNSVLGRTRNQSYLLWLALGTAAMAIAMASLLVFELAQKRAIEQSSALRSDSLTALVFQFEREYLRLRQSLADNLSSPRIPDPDALALRYDIFLSRLTLLRESPGMSMLSAREEYRKVIPRLGPLVAQMDQAMASTPMDRKALVQVQVEFNALGADMQALTLAANSEVARLLERQANTMRKQSDLIVWLTLAQLALLVIASGTLLVRHRRMEAERLALEQLTEELREAHFRAEAANRGKSQFLANMSHELRTPFNGLMGMLGLLQGTPLTAQQSDYIETAQGSASHLLTLLNDILDLSALETGKMTLKPGVLQLAGLLEDVRALMQPLAKDKGLAFEIRKPHRLPVVLADETRIKQILFNLISNAIKFTESGEVSLSVSESLAPAPRAEIVFAIRDTGIGMDADALSKLFQRFYQVDDSSTRRFGGTGLGLEISQSLARKMDGDITVVSSVGQGSTFTVRLSLPLADDALLQGMSQVESSLGNGTAGAGEMVLAPVDAPPAVVQAQPAAAGQSVRVLVVEDHPINQKLMGFLLARMDCQVSFCENGQLALDRVQQEAFDLILMDVNMPVMDGLTATRSIRQLPGAQAHIPIVVVTADVMNEARDQALAAGANEFLSKPLEIEQLRAMVLRFATVGNTA